MGRGCNIFKNRSGVDTRKVILEKLEDVKTNRQHDSKAADLEIINEELLQLRRYH